MSDEAKSRSRKFKSFLVVAFCAVAFAAGALKYNFFSAYENKSWDWRLGLIAKRGAADKSIKIITIDQASLDWAAANGITWPWPRSVYGQVLRFLKRGGARAVAFDLVFSETSVHQVEDDQQFVAELAKHLPVVNLLAFQSGLASLGEISLDYLRDKNLSINTRTNFQSRFLESSAVRREQSVLLPLPEIVKESAFIGAGTVEPDADGIFRRYEPGGYVSGIPVLNLGFALYEIGLLKDEVPVGKAQLQRFFDKDGKFMLRFFGPHGTYETVPIANVISSEMILSDPDEYKGRSPSLSPHIFRDAWVFLGVWAPGLQDIRTMPLDPVYRGVEFHATALDNLLHLHFLRKVGYWWSLAFAALFIMAPSFVTFMVHEVRFQFFAYTLALAALVMSAYLVATLGFWLPMVIPIVATIGSGMISLILVYNLEGRQRRFLRTAFSHYVSPSVINKLVNDPKTLSLGGEKRELTIFFSDLWGFSSFSEAMDPAKLVRLLNKYLTAMTDIILESGGTLDKYAGDGIIAFWNAPLPVPDHAYKAVKAALDCQKTLLSLAHEFDQEFGVTLRMRIGINTGMVSVGNFGSRDRFDYTVLGDSANLAARIEGVNKVFGTGILVTRATAERVGQRLVFRRVGDVTVVGRKEVVTLFEPLGENATLEQGELLNKFSKALADFDKGELSDALQEFEMLADDPVAKAYIKRLAKEFSSSSDNGAWSPTWNLQEK